jgi:hypothetical protein
MELVNYNYVQATVTTSNWSQAFLTDAQEYESVGHSNENLRLMAEISRKKDNRKRLK